MTFFHWLIIASCIPCIVTVAVNPFSKRLSPAADPLDIHLPKALGIQPPVHIVPDLTLQSHFVIGGWDPSFSNLTFVHKRADSGFRPNATLASPQGLDVHCHAERYGHPSRYSCGNAFVDIPEDRVRNTLADRRKQDSDVPLPFRFVSSKSYEKSPYGRVSHASGNSQADLI